jgi:hypothetical protein
MSDDEPKRPASDIAFSAAVKAVQAARGSRGTYEQKDAAGGWQTEISDDLARFIGEVTTCYLATASAAGQPYVQHRGGPPGFLRVLDRRTLGFVDYRGNRQYITTGHLAENAKAHLFLIDYENRRRVKIWGTARVIEGDHELAARLFPHGYRARWEQVILFSVATWDINCSQHIPQLFAAADVAQTIQSLQSRIKDLESEAAGLKARMAFLEAGGRPN